MPARPLLIGTRGSPLALWQARHVARAADGGARPRRGRRSSSASSPPRATASRTSRLREFGGKGLFTKEIDEALLSRRGRSRGAFDEGPADRCCPTGIIDRRGAAARRRARRLHQHQGAIACRAAARRGRRHLVVAARRRRCGALRPDLRVVDFRGNVETRLRKLDEGVADATLLALAGLERLGLAAHATSILSTDEMLPAVAQGAIGVDLRATTTHETRALLATLNDAHVRDQPSLASAPSSPRLDGSCKTPIAGLAEIEDGVLRFRGLILTPDGSEWHEIELIGAAAHAREHRHRRRRRVARPRRPRLPREASPDAPSRHPARTRCKPRGRKLSPRAATSRCSRRCSSSSSSRDVALAARRRASSDRHEPQCAPRARRASRSRRGARSFRSSPSARRRPRRARSSALPM